MNPRHQVCAVNAYIHDYIRFADAKAGVVLTVVSAVGVALGFGAPSVLQRFSGAHWFIFLLGVLACGAIAISVLMVLWHAVEAISPRVSSTTASLVSFPDIAKLPPTDYIERVTSLSPEQTAREYAAHNVTLARIAVAKFDSLSLAIAWARRALFCSYAALLSYAVSQMIM